MTADKKRLFIITGSFITIVIVASIIFLITSGVGSNKPDSSEAGIYTDPGTGEVVYSPTDRVPEDGGSGEKQIVFLGMTNLLDIGISSDMIANIKLQFEHLSSLRDSPITELSVNKSSIQQSIDQSTGEVTTTFIITINRSTELNSAVSFNSANNGFILKVLNPSDNTVLYDSNNYGD